MNVLLFTHANDIDGMGSIVLSKLVFDKVEYIPCETFEITKKVGEYIKNKEIYKYDFIYVTDLCIKEPLLTQINEDQILKNKIRVIDHHKSEIDEGNNKYDFVMMIMLDRNNISFRAVKDDVDVSKVATYYGGKGHVKAGACPISKEKKNKILELILK